MSTCVYSACLHTSPPDRHTCLHVLVYEDILTVKLSDLCASEYHTETSLGRFILGPIPYLDRLFHVYISLGYVG